MLASMVIMISIHDENDNFGQSYGNGLLDDVVGERPVGRAIREPPLREGLAEGRSYPAATGSRSGAGDSGRSPL